MRCVDRDLAKPPPQQRSRLRAEISSMRSECQFLGPLPWGDVEFQNSPSIGTNPLAPQEGMSVASAAQRDAGVVQW